MCALSVDVPQGPLYTLGWTVASNLQKELGAVLEIDSGGTKIAQAHVGGGV